MERIRPPKPPSFELPLGPTRLQAVRVAVSCAAAPPSFALPLTSFPQIAFPHASLLVNLGRALPAAPRVVPAAPRVVGSARVIPLRHSSIIGESGNLDLDCATNPRNAAPLVDSREGAKLRVRSRQQVPVLLATLCQRG